MQKTAFLTLLREELTRAFVFGLGFFAILTVGFTSVAYAANGGAFGEILNKILSSGNWEAPGDGTVRNAMSLGNMTADKFVPVKAGQSCGAGKCITGFQADGTVNCTP